MCSRISSEADSESHFTALSRQLLTGCVYMLCSQQTYTCLGNSYGGRCTYSTCTHISHKQMGRLIKKVYGKERLSWRGNKMLQELKCEIYVGNGTVLRKNRKINYCLAAVEDMDHFARALRKYLKNSNIKGPQRSWLFRELQFPVTYQHLPYCAETNAVEPIGDGFEYIRSYFIKLIVKHLSGSKIQDLENCTVFPISCRCF